MKQSLGNGLRTIRRMMMAVPLIALSSYSIARVPSGNWQVVGPGNATCNYWLKAKEVEKREILAWMAGYASAENLDLARNAKAEYRLELLTYDYMRHEIDKYCFNRKNSSESMLGVLSGILMRFPKET